jgi:hypothetical protein
VTIKNERGWIYFYEIMRHQLTHYQHLLQLKGLKPDPHQLKGLQLLSELHAHLLLYDPPEKRTFQAKSTSSSNDHPQLSPDFAWIKQSEASILDKVSEC